MGPRYIIQYSHIYTPEIRKLASLASVSRTGRLLFRRRRRRRVAPAFTTPGALARRFTAAVKTRALASRAASFKVESERERGETIFPSSVRRVSISGRLVNFAHVKSRQARRVVFHGRGGGESCATVLRPSLRFFFFLFLDTYISFRSFDYSRVHNTRRFPPQVLFLPSTSEKSIYTPLLEETMSAEPSLFLSGSVCNQAYLA